MNTFTKFLSLSLFVWLIGACSSTAPLTMDMNLEKGATIDYVVTTTNDMGMSIMGQDMSTTGTFEQDYQFMVKDVSPSGVTDVDFKITRIVANQSVPMMGDMSYDSQKSDNGDSPFAGLAGMIGKEMSANLDRRGNVNTIEGADAIIKEVLGKIKGGEQVSQMLENYVGESSFKRVFNSLTGFSQGKPLKAGDSWSRTTDNESNIGMITDYTYTIREREKGLVTIDVTGTTKSDPDAEPIESQGMKISYDLKGPVNGVIVVDEKTGWAISSDIQQNLDGKFVMSGTPMGDMNLDAKMKIGVQAKRK